MTSKYNKSGFSDLLNLSAHEMKGWNPKKVMQTGDSLIKQAYYERGFRGALDSIMSLFKTKTSKGLESSSNVASKVVNKNNLYTLAGFFGTGFRRIMRLVISSFGMMAGIFYAHWLLVLLIFLATTAICYTGLCETEGGFMKVVPLFFKEVGAMLFNAVLFSLGTAGTWLGKAFGWEVEIKPWKFEKKVSSGQAGLQAAKLWGKIIMFFIEMTFSTLWGMFKEIMKPVALPVSRTFPSFALLLYNAGIKSKNILLKRLGRDEVQTLTQDEFQQLLEEPKQDEENQTYSDQ